MRKITEESVGSFLVSSTYSKDNTEVMVGLVDVWLLLHGHKIAHRNRKTGELRITTAGWDTPTTKERLNGLPGVSVHHSKHQLYLNDLKWDGEWVTI